MQCPYCRTYCDDSEKECPICGRKFNIATQAAASRKKPLAHTTARMNSAGARPKAANDCGCDAPKHTAAPTQPPRTAKQPVKKAPSEIFRLVILIIIAVNVLSAVFGSCSFERIADGFATAEKSVSVPLGESISAPSDDNSTHKIIYTGEGISLALLTDGSYLVKTTDFSEKGSFAMEEIDPADDPFPEEYPSDAYACVAFHFDASEVNTSIRDELQNVQPSVVYAYIPHNEDDTRLHLQNKFGAAFWLPLDRIVTLTLQS